MEAKQGDKSRLGADTEDESGKQKNLPRCPSAVYLLDSFAGESSKQLIDTITLYAIAILTTEMKTSFQRSITSVSCLPLGTASYKRLTNKEEGDGTKLLSITFKVKPSGLFSYFTAS